MSRDKLIHRNPLLSCPTKGDQWLLCFGKEIGKEMIGDAHKFLLAPGGADVETDEPTPSFRSEADEDITEGPGPMIVGNLVSTQL